MNEYFDKKKKRLIHNACGWPSFPSQASMLFLSFFINQEKPSSTWNKISTEGTGGLDFPYAAFVNIKKIPPPLVYAMDLDKLSGWNIWKITK
ncbi:hypothetical protein Leryth_004689 [Lithospermum erythrorhizon]|nr:hypothetical protein Leryth_004689 [Lithospermum erythrorhizon]